MNERLCTLTIELLQLLKEEADRDGGIIRELREQNEDLKKERDELLKALARKDEEVSKALAQIEEYREYKRAMLEVGEMAQKLGFKNIYEVISTYPLDDVEREREIRRLVLAKWETFLKVYPGADVLKGTVICRIWADFKRAFGISRLVSLPRNLYPDAVKWLREYIPPLLSKYGPLSEKLMETRVKRGHNAKQAAVEIGVSRSTVSRWELGVQLPRVTVYQSLADYLGLTVMELEHLIDRQARHNELMETERVALPAVAGPERAVSGYLCSGARIS